MKNIVVGNTKAVAHIRTPIEFPSSEEKHRCWFCRKVKLFGSKNNRHNVNFINHDAMFVKSPVIYVLFFLFFNNEKSLYKSIKPQI